ncbi:AgmX/PglI C-terminal domain-containing protein [Marinobacter sediminum]|nr:AgmX/PglI C-terminal domain-containing protein [Marinobacter sediminum]
MGASPGLPWSADAGERRRFGVILGLTLIVFVPPAFLIPTLEVPEIERSEAEKVPPQLARLIERPKPPAQPEKIQPGREPEPKPEPEAEPEPEVTTPSPDLPEPQLAQPEQDPEPVQNAPERQTVEQAREKASSSGLLAMKDRLASLRASKPAPAKRLQANAGAEGLSGDPVVTESETALQGSGGVEDADAPRARVAVDSHQVKQVKPTSEPVRKVAGAKAPKPSAGERAMSNIRKVFATQKTALYSLYRRELRQDPTLAGKVLLELVIEPDGSVSACDVVNSELENPALERRIAMRVRLFNFGSDNVEARKVRFPVDFLPG